jgi:hypothetical protein
MDLMATPVMKGESQDRRGPKQREETGRGYGFHVAIQLSDLVEACCGTSNLGEISGSHILLNVFESNF